MITEHLFYIGLFAVLLFMTIYLWGDCNGEKNYICKVTIDPNKPTKGSENYRFGALVPGAKPRRKRLIFDDNEDDNEEL